MCRLFGSEFLHPAAGEKIFHQNVAARAPGLRTPVFWEWGKGWELAGGDSRRWEMSYNFVKWPTDLVFPKR